jgi:fermentation-respiration switch protein FrsA (DUF1100 family)
MSGPVPSSTDQKKPQTWRRRLFRLAIPLVGAYLGVIVVLMFLENRLVYHPVTAEEEWLDSPGPEVQDVYLTSADGTAVHAWWWPVAGAPGAILYSHGNAGNLSHRGRSVAQLRALLGESVLIFDYPGYGKSAGRPSEKGCCLAGEAAYDWLVQEQGIDPERIILFGGSLGGGIAVHLASQRKHRALVLAKTFTSLPDVAQSLYPWLPVRWLMRNRFDNLGKIGDCHRPVFFIHSTGDDLIPFRLAQRLYTAANQPKQFFEIPGGDHNDPLPTNAFRQLQVFLHEHANSRP